MNSRASQTPGPNARISSVDALRGLVMILMALDHTRDFFHLDAAAFQPDDLSRASAALFLTRWITHFCAPVFMFTAGLGAWFWRSRNFARSRAQLSRFLLIRGLWLIILELTAMHLAINFNLNYSFIFLLVLWALGCSMVILALLIHLPFRLLAAISIAVIALHNLAGPLLILHSPGIFHLGPVTFLAAYPLVPWFAVMSAGYCFGPLLQLPNRRRILLLTGASIALAFLLLRAFTAYGEPQPAGHTILSFLRCTKYPPSLDFLLMTLGPALVVLAWLDGFRFHPANPLIVFGRVPLFYFVLHFFAIHALALLLAQFRYGHSEFMWNPLPSMGGPAKLFPAGYGYSLPVVYILWIVIVALMYPLCLWFARLKSRRRDWWLSYL